MIIQPLPCASSSSSVRAGMQLLRTVLQRSDGGKERKGTLLCRDEAMSFHPEQSLNDWVVVLDALYGGSQNYAKTAFKIHAHLTEVCGVCAKHLFKRRDRHNAVRRCL